MKKPHYWQKGSKELSKKDKKLAVFIERYQDKYLTSYGDAFKTLANAIVGQQISVAACDAIWQRLLDLCPRKKITIKNFKKLKESALKEIGLSRQKILYLNNIADYFIENKITEKYFKENSSAEIAEELLAIKGIGKWTLEMFQIFYLNEADVFPVGDIGLIKAIQKIYSSPKRKFEDKESIVKYSKKWAPYRTIATWYLWRTIDTEPVHY